MQGPVLYCATLLRLDRFASQQAEQLSPLFRFAVSAGPPILV